MKVLHLLRLEGLEVQEELEGLEEHINDLLVLYVALQVVDYRHYIKACRYVIESFPFFPSNLYLVLDRRVLLEELFQLLQLYEIL
jgi:hypothetical protein